MSDVLTFWPLLLVASVIGAGAVFLWFAVGLECFLRSYSEDSWKR